MGKDLRGREIGRCLTQRTDGLYCARIRVHGKDYCKYFTKLKEAKEWVSTAQFEIDCGNIYASNQMFVDTWYEHWINKIKSGKLAPKTKNDYMSFYEIHISPEIGRMKLESIRAIHCTNVLNIMKDKGMADGSIKKGRTLMHDLFGSAVENGLMPTNPVSKSVSVKGKEKKEKYIMTPDEENAFLEEIRDHCHYTFFAFILQTGLRFGEITGLKWDDIDLEKRMLTVSRSMEWSKDTGRFEEKPPKTKSGYRTVPLSEEAIRIIRLQKEIVKKIPVVAGYEDYVFKNRNGKPSQKTTLNKGLKSIMARIGLPTISVHCLRHTFATRCIEDGIRPKTLQKVLGHSKLSVTMDLYVHVTEDELVHEFEKFGIGLKMAM